MSVDFHFQLEKNNFVLDTSCTLSNPNVNILFGRSGAGKTTLLRCIAGLEHGAQGHLIVNDKVWQRSSDDIFLPTHKRPIGYVFQHAALFPHLDVRENLDYACKRAKGDKRQVSFDSAVEELGISHLLNRNPSGLSGGERQRVAIARAVLSSPEILLFDEPLTALDTESKYQILSHLKTICQKFTIPVVYVSHLYDEVARIGDFLVLLKNGKVEATGCLSEMFTRLDLPLSHSNDAGAIIEARIIGHDTEFHLTNLEFSGEHLLVAHKELPIGTLTRLFIHARDVSLTLKRQNDSSILNILEARILDMHEECPFHVMIRLEVRNSVILARITLKSAAQLKLEKGMTVFAQVKSVALL